MYKKLNYFLFFILIILQLKLSAQETKDINGLVFSKDSVSVENIHIFNSSLNKGTITNKKGEFRIMTRINDTLVISSIGIKKKQVVILESHHNKKNKLSIEVHIQITDLDEIILSSHGLSGNLNQDIENLKKPLSISPSDVGLPYQNFERLTYNERQLQLARGFGLVSLMNTISGRTKMLKSHVDLDNRIKSVNTARKMFNDDFIISLGIPTDKVNEFWYYCESDSNIEQIINEDNFENILIFLSKKVKSFLG
ncbi:carboxypeptidase-like regulatory domain-containing protein [Pseudotamlana carrageenivorans]|uniref:Carboxypeptidase-like regulatory domain-containing protein n=1 Tax=Pseudotamlana carrageenivorans TaxID=2069432 RepID=A0A2I7SJP3_9FLAO|nr:carboxypeptidase-like regulatory domain-containing protein [Tamlana carrageenivorans]AUS06111.1 hypothetical protein C1A40_11905 [Tamlana carrageenivorans]